MSKFEKEIENYLNKHPLDEVKIALDACLLLEECAEEIENLYGRETELTNRIRDFLK
jgi:hypothetical protein